jgi:MFS family permease
VSRARTLALLTALYLTQGLPYGFQVTALPIYLRGQRGASLVVIGLTSALSLPWILKALWAPLVDRYGSARLGRRRAWIIPLEAGLVLACVAGAVVHEQLVALLALVLLLNLLAATQDIAVDGLAVDLLRGADLGPGNAAQVCGYKVGMILSGGLFLWAAERLDVGWTGVFLAMAAVTAGVLGVVLAWREPPAPARAAEVTSSLGDVLRALRAGLAAPGGGWLLVFIGTYRLGESMVDAMSKPFLVDMGFSKGQLALWVGTYGMVASLLGSLSGGLLAARTDLVRAVGATALVRCLPLALLAALAGAAARGPLGDAPVIAVTCVEHFTTGALTTALFAFMMSRVDPAVGASHYTLLASVEVLGKAPGALASGWVAQRVGYAPLFAAGALASVVLLAPLVALRRRGA